MTAEFAPAKVNLYLHVGSLAADGYHPLESWMVFADVGDEVRLVPGDMTFAVEGPFANGVPTDGSNLVLRARDAFLARRPLEPFGLVLAKRLPPASGIGGGSSDAAAVLRLLQRHAPLAQDELYEIAASLGADVPACLKASSLLARGRGDVLMDAPQTPPIPVVLVNPGAPMSTAAVFRAFDQYPAPAREPMLLGSTALSVAQVLGRLEGTANDLEPHAKDLSPEIAKVLDALSRDPRSRLVRMSGSGATCFAITDTAKSAQSVAGCIAAAHPSWWVKATLLR